jgi:sarcosine oxidase gamma subunit
MMASQASAEFLMHATDGVRRTGLKGRGAADLLARLDVPLPAHANQVRRFTSPWNGRCLRLGNTEYLIEQDEGETGLNAIDAAAEAGSAGVLGALRRDRCFLLSGGGVPAALRQIAAFDFEGPAFGADDVVMTLMAGISVSFVREPALGAGALRLWCDAGFGAYLQDCFVALGGRPDSPFSSPPPHREP